MLFQIINNENDEAILEDSQASPYTENNVIQESERPGLPDINQVPIAQQFDDVDTQELPTVKLNSMAVPKGTIQESGASPVARLEPRAVQEVRQVPVINADERILPRRAAIRSYGFQNRRIRYPKSKSWTRYGPNARNRYRGRRPRQ